MSSTEALVFDAIRTPRGKGKSNGSLHGTKPVDLVVGLIHETLSRQDKLDPNEIDDLVLGCAGHTIFLPPCGTGRDLRYPCLTWPARSCAGPSGGMADALA